MADQTPSSSVAITTSGKDYLSQSATVLADAFANDPAITYLLNVLPPSKQDPYRHTLFNAFYTGAALNGASFTEADEWRCVGVLLPPGKNVDNPLTLVQSGLFGVLWNLGIKGVWRMTHEYASKPATLKSRTLETHSKKAYYIFNLGTKEEYRGNGLSTHLIHHYQSLAAATNAPIWLEATTAYSHNLYTKLGFHTAGEIVLGQGVAGADGTVSKGGEGVKIWGMVWWPPVKKEEEEIVVYRTG
ncbi:hypothetical protein BU16DRAFT_612550 [Lophium mytilinum]|uniref:N-acetyltransferase domain-containing protein n=1 Tax=Lophium mytilinum TaxID=390894 RepID=A0A6A6RF47_9PEZI|nr:hypothetical protein BU16DRAFT_612550 [Lophium mytilinum]